MGFAKNDDMSFVHVSNGCGSAHPPNCLPGKCLTVENILDVNMCWECTSSEFIIDPDFTPPARCRCRSNVKIPGSDHWGWWKCTTQKKGRKTNGYCVCRDGYTFNSDGRCIPCESSTTEDESELASVNKKLKQTNKALLEALQHLEENEV